MLLEADALGAVCVNLEAEKSCEALPDSPGIVRIGVHRRGAPPSEGLGDFDILLSASLNPPRPWIGVEPEKLDQAIAHLTGVIARQPVAAAICAQVHRMALALPFEQALLLESFAYSTLLASDGFAAWRAATPIKARAERDPSRVSLAREHGVLSIQMTRVRGRNAIDARMRDELVEALQFALADPYDAPVVLAGAGPSFSIGGDLDEFGMADDAGRAHAIRTFQSPVKLIHRLGARLTVRVHGPCIGAGIEMPAAAARIVARPGAYFRLPEVTMGLIPGAGGTVSIPRRIGRHRACYAAISGADIDEPTALAWGLIDAIEEGP